MDGSNFIAFAAQRSSTGGHRNNLTVVDKVLPEILHLIDPHWYQFPPMNPIWHGIIGFAIALLGVISIVGNGMVIYIFCTTKELRTPSNLLVINLALSDFLMMVTNSPPMVISCYFETWVFGPLFCELYAMFGGLFGVGSIWSMVFIALDRYTVIVKGLSAKPLTIKTALLRIMIIWFIGTLFSTLPIVGWNRYIPEGNMSACGTDYLTKNWFHRSYILIYSFFAYFLPLSTIIYSYWFIVSAVAAHEKSMREQAKKMNVASLRSSETQQTSAEIKLAKVALVTISLWFMAWTPYLVTNYIGIFELAQLTPLSTIWCAIFAKASSVYNPIVYAISHPKYKQAMEKKFPSLACASKSNNDTASHTSDATQVCNTDSTPTA